MKELVKTVLSLEKGELYLAGIDKFLEDEAWEKIDETHPQHELKELLDYLTVRREDIPDLQAPENFGRDVCAKRCPVMASHVLAFCEKMCYTG